MRRGIWCVTLFSLVIGGLSAAVGEDGFSFKPRSATSRLTRPLKPLEFFTGRRDSDEEPKEEPLPADVDANSASRRGEPASSDDGTQRFPRRQPLPGGDKNRFADEASLSQYTRRSQPAPNPTATIPDRQGTMPEIKNYHRALFGTDPPPRGSAGVQQVAAEQFEPNNQSDSRLLGHNQPSRNERPVQTIPVDVEETIQPSQQSTAKPAWYEQLQKSPAPGSDAGQGPAARILPARNDAEPAITERGLRTAERHQPSALQISEGENPKGEFQPPQLANQRDAEPSEVNITPFETVSANSASGEPQAPAGLPNWAANKPTSPSAADRTEPERPKAPLLFHTSNARTSSDREAAPRADITKKGAEASPFGKTLDSRTAASGDSVSALSDDGQAPSVTVEWVKRSAISVGQECQCDLLVKNNGEVAAQDVLVEAYFPESVRLTKCDPAPTESVDHLTWRFDTLAAGAEKTIHIAMIPSKRGDLATRAMVRFTGAAANTFRVEEPLLKLAVKGPKEVGLGDPASQIVTVSNPGNGTAHNVIVAAYIPEGLDHPQGKEVKLSIGSLSAGESRQVRLPLAAVGGGEQLLAVEAQAGNALKQVAESRINIIAPALKIELDGPGLRYMGRSADYRLTVQNVGTAATNNVRAVHEIPEGFEFVRADKGGAYDASAGTVSWFLGRVEAGDGVELHVRLKPTQLGDHVHQAAAFSEHGSRSEARTETRVDGTASLVLEIADLDDPVEVGVETGYEIRVQNEGTKAAQNVDLSCELPGGVELVDAKGPADFRVENGIMHFQTLRELAPGQTASFQVRVRGTAEGHQRFRARLTSDSIQEPLLFEELTKFYQD